jgi:multidrug efflux pump subunit AcrA (membrane-fusion protein)
MKLETKDRELEKNKLEALLVQSQAGLEKLLKGETQEEIDVLETKFENAKKSLEDSEINLTNVGQKAETDLANPYSSVKNILYDAYTKADDAVTKQTDEMFSDDSSDSPQLTFTTNSQLEIDSESQRMLAGRVLKTFKAELDVLSSEYLSLDEELKKAENHLIIIRDFLNKLNEAVNSAAGLSLTTASSYKTSIYTGRANVNYALSNVSSQKQSLASQKIINQNNISAAKTKVNEARAVLELTQSELTLKKAPARNEDIEIAKAKIREIEEQIAIIKETIKKSTLFAPIPAEIKKIYLEEKEVFQPGKTALSLSAAGFKIQADVSELEIGKIKEVNGNDVLIRFDAFLDQELKGKVIFIEPEEITKEGDKYYRVNVEIAESGGLELRSGMSADLTLITSAKDNILKIPEFAVYKKEGKSFVKILENNRQKEVEIETGISDGQSVEAVKGLIEGEIVVVSTD